MNLMTDQYITTSFEDFNEKGYEGKLLGFITIQFILFLIVIFRIFFPNSDFIQQNGTLRSIFIAINPILSVPFLSFLYALSVNNFQGYYLKKYLEDYRQLSDYSIEDWYGKESKRYKESLEQEV